MGQHITPVVFRNVTSQRPDGGISTVSFTLEPHDVYAVLGGSGSGKTAVADLVMGFRRPDSGSVEVLGQDPVAQAIRIRQLVAFVDGRSRLPGPMTPPENLTFLARLTATDDTHDTHVNALRRMGLPDRCLTEPAETLPAQAHVSMFLALAWLRRTPLLVLDDPTAGFDSVATATFIEALEELRRAGIAILLTTSDVLLAGRAADHIAILKGGEKVAERRRDQLLQDSLTSLYADYIGRTDILRRRL